MTGKQSFNNNEKVSEAEWKFFILLRTPFF